MCQALSFCSERTHNELVIDTELHRNVGKVSKILEESLSRSKHSQCCSAIGLPWWLSSGKKKNQPAIQETWVQSLSPEDLLEEGVATHPGILAWEIPWTEGYLP